MTPEESLELSVVVPCFNEAAVITELVDRLSAVLSRSGRQYEVLLVDDGSSDDTLERLRAVNEERPAFRYISLSRNFGKEGAMLAGLRAARGDAVVIMDADLQHPPELILPMLERLGAGFEQVVARRDRDGDPRVRTMASRLYYRLVNRMIDVDLQDGVGDFRVMARPALQALLSLEETNRFSKGLMAWIGFRTAYIDYRNAPRAAGTSTWGMKSLFNYGVDSVISFNAKPLRQAIHFGILAALLAFGYGAWVLLEALINGNPVPGYVTIMCAIVGLGGVQMFLIGVMGEYLGRIYIETKARPTYVVRETSEESR